LILGLILIPVMCFWNEYTEIVAQATDLAAMSLIIAVVFALFVLVLINRFLKKYFPRYALTAAELMFIYVMQTVSIGISGIVVLLWVMLCLNVLIRKQWMDQERLSFPIVQLPLELARDGGSEAMLGSRQMWIGFLIPVVMESLASLNYLYPNIPFLPIKPSD